MNNMSLKRNIYRILRVSNDINAIRRGRIGRRVGRRVAGRMSGKLIRRIFK